MEHELYTQVDSQLAAHAQDPRAVIHGFSPYGGDYVAVLTPGGQYVAGSDPIPIDAAIRHVASGKAKSFYRNAPAETQGGMEITLREIVTPFPGNDGAVIV